MRRTARRQRRREDGFTLIEVMMALGVLTVGALAILALQQAAIRGNMSAREMSVATEINRRWIEQFRLDTLNWRTNTLDQSGIEDVGTMDNLLANLSPDGNPTAWLTPPDGGGADFRGVRFQSLPPPDGTPPPKFCTNYRLAWVVPGTVARVTVRTWWHRTGSGQGNTAVVDATLFPDCENPGDSAELQPGGRLHQVETSAVLRWSGTNP